MTRQFFSWDRLLYVVPVVFLLLYLFFAWYATRDTSYHFATVIQAERVWGIDDNYRQLLSSMPFFQLGGWFWDYYLPFNLIFDGTFSRLTGHDVFWMRVPRAVLVMTGLILVLRAGRHMGIAPVWLLLSASMLLLMPLNVLLSTSFYGEALLAGVMGFLVYALVTDRPVMQVPVAALMPFIRPEGAFYLGLLALQKALARQWRQACLMLLPAMVYAIAVLLLFDSLSAFFTGRQALSAHYPILPENLSSTGAPFLPYYTINILWWVAALSGACLPQMRRLWPLFIGVILVMLHWFWKAQVGDARGEARYFYSAFPLFVLSQAVLLDTLFRRARAQWKKAAGAVCVVLVLAIIIENFAQIDPLRHHVFGDRRWPVAGEQGSMPVLYTEDEDVVAWKKETALFLKEYVSRDRSIKKIVVNTWQIFPMMDMQGIPDRVRLELSPIIPGLAFQYYDGYFYSMFPDTPHYSFYNFAAVSEPRPYDSDGYALYVGPLYNGIYSPVFANPVIQVYKVHYRASLQSPFFSRQDRGS